MELLGGLFFWLVVLWIFIGWPIHYFRKQARLRREALTYNPPNNGSAASWATDAEIEAAGGFIPGGIFVGVTIESQREVFYHPGEGQLKPTIVYGGMGSGKTTSNQIPLALTWGLKR
jgi:hypothetical protein